ncbi:hypothetical protein BDP27DRAFT_304134 [Rhodocollybia butyracea]|uniref:Uncharacterized protein n=1 Tax=Rhodocollybia butyracea TaxID=206335 RepID=A0A9P5U176_9AGAR|nr:hypothetical protein BDP27DRAFT_304134 [Rhodocollybia butyracea]
MVKLTEERLAEKRIQDAQLKAIQSRGKNDYGSSDWENVPLLEGSQTRTDLVLLKELQNRHPQSPEALWTLLNDATYTSTNDEKFQRSLATMRATIRKDEGNFLFKAGKYNAAISKYREAMGYILERIEPDTPLCLPAPQYLYPKYLYIGKHCMEKPEGTWLEYVDLLALAGNIAQSYSKLGDHVQTIDWIQEAMQMMVCQRLMTLEDMPSWKDNHISLVEYWQVVPFPCTS